MTAPHCGRLDRHAPHEWTGRAHIGFDGKWHPPFGYQCPGVIETEGGQICVTCQAPTAGCRCDTQRDAREYDEWWDDAS